MITMRIDDDGLSVNLANARQVTGVMLQKWITAVVQHVQKAVAKNIGNDGLIGRRTGTLARSLMSLVTVNSDGSVMGEVWPDPDKAPYGTIQEDGGTIVPKNAAHLTIPLDAMLTANGVARGTAADVIANPQAFGFASTFVNPSKTVIMGLFVKGDTDPIPLFALVTSVVIPARHYLATTLTQELTWIQEKLEQITGEDVQTYFGAEAVAS